MFLLPIFYFLDRGTPYLLPPLYFQLVLGLSPRTSGIQSLPVLVTMPCPPIASGAMVSTLSFYVPFMWLGAILATVGSGLLFTLLVDSPSGTLSKVLSTAYSICCPKIKWLWGAR